jgi:Tetratricopeptide repeat
MATTEIEKLERRYAENPQGLTFAPLAEVHRKNGDVGRALELLRAGLELHPNYIPASIVLGRCQWDAGDLPAAESAFAHVLRLDDENVIALKSLADINERLERFGEAQRWLNRLLSVDRSNDEARQQLARLETAKQEADRKPPPPSSVVAESSAAGPTVPEPAEPEANASAELPPEIAALEPEPVPEPSPKPPAEPALIDLTATIAEPPSPRQEPVEELSIPAAPATSPAIEFLDTSEPAAKDDGPASSEEPAPLSGLVSAEFEPPKESAYRLHPELTRDFVPEPEPLGQLEVETDQDLELQSSGASEFRVPNAAEDFMDLAAGMSTPRSRELEEEIPPPVTARSTEPEEEIPAPVAAPPPAPVAAALEPEPAQSSKPSYAARETNGQSVASFFASLLAARPPGASSPPAGPASSSAPQSQTEALAVPTAESSAAAEVSFDEFFGAAAGGSSQAGQGNSEPGKDDLDQFQSWLQNLKR